MSVQSISSSPLAAPAFARSERTRADSSSGLAYVRSGRRAPGPEITSNAGLRSLATDGAGRATSFYAAHSVSDLKNKAGAAAGVLEDRLKPGQVIDLGLLHQGKVSGYVCRMTASGDGYLVQTHEQAKSGSTGGMFFPAVSNSHAGISMDATAVTDVNQLPPQMYNALHSLTRFVSRQPIEHWLIKL